MPKIIAVHSYRGGTGKSNLVANLATAIASVGKRVAVIDTDVQSPGIHNIFDLGEDKLTYTLNDYLWGRCPIDAATYEVSQAAGVAGQGNVLLVPASIDPDEIARILTEGYSANLLNDGIRQLIRHYDLNYLFIDTHPGLSKETFLSIAISNLLILLLRPDRQDFQGTAVTIDLARQLLVPELLLVVNKVLPKVDFVDLQEQLEKTYQAAVAGIFPVAEEMFQLGSNGIFCQEYPNHVWTATLIQIANRIMQNPAH